MKMIKKVSAVLLSVAFSICLFLQTGITADAEEAGYTYTVRLHLAFTGDDATAKFADRDEDTIVITNLKYGDQVSINAKSLVEIKATNEDVAEKYYVKGIRVSGDNDATSASSFMVTKDIDYVVAYGVGATVPYKVRYIDPDGNELFPEETYYGPADEEIYVSYKYKEGFVPNTYNYYAKKLEAPVYDETTGELISCTVFTFNYVEGKYSVTDTQYITGYSTTGGGSSIVYETIPGITVTTGGNTTTVDAGAAGNAGGAGNGAAGNGGAGNGGAAADDNQTIDDTPVPESAPQQVIDIDDTQTPTFADRVSDNIIPIIAFAIVIVAIIAIVVALIVNRKRSKATEASESNKEE